MKSLIVLLFAVIACNTSYARGVEGGGGGDVKCDAKIKSIADNIATWIQGRGPEIGQLDLSSSYDPKTGAPYTYSEYDHGMLKLLLMPLDSSCVAKKDIGYPVKVGVNPKICTSFVLDDRVHIKCDEAKFLNLSPDQEIEQIHHEYAINIPGLEPDSGSISTYRISWQLSAYTKTVSERRLVVTKTNCTSARLQDRARGMAWWAAANIYQSLGFDINKNPLFRQVNDTLRTYNEGIEQKYTDLSGSTQYSVISTVGEFKRLFIQSYINPLKPHLKSNYTVPMASTLQTEEAWAWNAMYIGNAKDTDNLESVLRQYPVNCK